MAWSLSGCHKLMELRISLIGESGIRITVIQSYLEACCAEAMSDLAGIAMQNKHAEREARHRSS